MTATNTRNITNASTLFLDADSNSILSQEDTDFVLGTERFEGDDRAEFAKLNYNKRKETEATS